VTALPPGGLTRRVVALFQRSAALAALVSAVAVISVAAATVLLVRLTVPGSAASGPASARSAGPRHVVVTLPAHPDSYLGAYVQGVPRSYAPLQSLAAATGTRPNVALYYSGWGEPFQTTFAQQAARHGAVPLVQIDPGETSLASIADGAFDTYLESFAGAVAGFGAATKSGVIIGFGHEPNGRWYPWGYRHASPRSFVAAWRHIVTVFRDQGADNVTWLWTVNIIDKRGGIPSPAPWWPGARYVTWVGIDGYYLKPSWRFAPLFGPTIKVVRSLALLDPILISETAATPAAGKPAKIADVFAGIRAYGLLGLVWFDVDKNRDWQLSGPAAIGAFRQGAASFGRSGS
jgi:mannan endo-1,4-beta-mannosidase